MLTTLVCVTLQGCTMAPSRHSRAGPIVPKELNMQSATDPPDKRKPRPPIPEMVGATSAPFYIGPERTQISLPIHPPKGPALGDEGSVKRKVILQVENVTGEKRAPSFDVYLNVPAGESPERHPELHAGGLGLFGLVESSAPQGEHAGNGMTFKLDISALFTRLSAMKGWDPQNLRLTFVAEDWDAPVPKVRVGRVSLYFS
jgi:tyrosinase